MNEPNPMCSVIIPCYNSVYWRRAVASALSQTYSNIEVVLVDDGSSPPINSKEIPQDKRLRLVTQVNSGSSIARNTGVAHSHGDFLVFLDADDEILPLHVQNLIGIAIESSSQLAVCGCIWINMNSKEIIRHEIPVLPAFPKLFSSNFAPIHCWLISKNLFRELMGFNCQILYFEDWEFWFRACIKSEKVMLSQACNAIYYQHDEQKSLRNISEALPSEVQIKTEFISQWLSFQNRQTEYTEALFWSALITYEKAQLNRYNPQSLQGLNFALKELIKSRDLQVSKTGSLIWLAKILGLDATLRLRKFFAARN
jgi:glycosyltransferase involved in cell wall biosynthesis